MLKKLTTKFLLWAFLRFDWSRWPKIDHWLYDIWYYYGEDNETMYCQDCGCIIEWDLKQGDDIIRPAYVTASGDLFCDRCGKDYDWQDEAEANDYYDNNWCPDCGEPLGVCKCTDSDDPPDIEDWDDEPDFTLDDLEWEEAYPELSEDEERE